MKVQRQFEVNKPSDFAKTLAFLVGNNRIRLSFRYISGVEAVSEKDIQRFVEKYFVGKSVLTTVLINKKDAEEFGIKDTSVEYKATLLKNY